MKALVMEDFSVPAKLADVPLPEPGAGEVGVRVQAASIHGFDLMVASGMLKGMMEYRFPVVMDRDFAGVVDAVGEGVEGFRPGDRVSGVVMTQGLHDGAIGEFATLPVALGIAELPDGRSFPVAGALGLAGAAALASLDAAGVGPGDAHHAAKRA